MPALPPLRYLAGADVIAAMPSPSERLALAELTLRGLAGDAEMPPKIGVHPRPEGAFGHAMPAYLPGDDPSGSADLVGMKWVLGYPTNTALGLPGIHGTLLLSDPVTGVPVAVMDASPITAERTAAISGVAIRAWAPSVVGRAPRAAIIGAGVQGTSHVAMLGHVLPGATLRVFDRDPARADALAAHARATTGIAGADTATTAREAVEGADVVITAASFVPPPERQVMTGDWLGPETLVVPVDYATYCSAEVARTAALFVVDHREQFLVNREAGQFDGYPDPAAMMGEVLATTADIDRPSGRVVATHLGTGLADVVFGSAILAAATRLGLGTELPAVSAPDLLVVGAGVMGAWTALEARRGGRTVTLLDAYGAGHARATSGDQTRISRCGHGADALYSRWARESQAGWRRLEAETGQVLFRESGALWFTGEDRAFADVTVPTLRSLDIPVELLLPDEVHARWPQIATDDITGAVYEPEAGLLMAARGCATAVRRLGELGGSFSIGSVRPGRVDGDRLLDVEDGAGKRSSAETFVFAAGPWLPRLFPDVVGSLVSVTKQDVVYLGPAAGDERWTDAAIPCWVDMAHPFYGLPSAEGGGFKVAPDRFGPAWDPTDGDRLVDPDAVRVARAYAERRFPGIARQPVIEARVCQYEMTPDSHFLIDRHPAFSNVWLVGGGSGHGYKHGPEIGRHVVGRLDGGPAPDDNRFALDRPRNDAGSIRIGGDGLVAAWEGY